MPLATAPIRRCSLGNDSLYGLVAQAGIRGGGQINPSVISARSRLSTAHIHGAVEIGAIHDPHAGRRNVAMYRRSCGNQHGRGAVKVSFHCALDDNSAGMRVPDNNTINSDGHALSVPNRTLDPALQNQILVGCQLAP